MSCSSGPKLHKNVEGGSNACKSESCGAADMHKLVDLHVRHILRQEDELQPMAERLPTEDEEQLDHVGRAMREGRGIDPIT